jgi:regulatory protein
MAGKISGLRVQQRTPDRVNVYLDGQFAFGLPAMYAAQLRVGQHLSDAEIEQLQATDLLERAYDRAARYLSYRPRSESEVRRYLAGKEIAPAVVDAVIERLRERRYLDDAEFARFWVENRQRFRPRGARALRQELRLKGVDAETIEGAVAAVEPETAAYEAGLPRAQRLAALAEADPPTFRRRLTEFLLRRGFDYGVARDAVTRLAREVGSADTLFEDDDAG